ncbi:hypothetical protein PJL16_29205, partial [Mycobacterium kansasii]
MAKWMMMLVEYDIEFIPHKSIKGSALVNFLADNPVDGEEADFGFPDKDIMLIENGNWKLYFDGASGKQGYGIWILL